MSSLLWRDTTPWAPQQLTYRLTPHLRSVDELLSHIALDRLGWFHRMSTLGSGSLPASSLAFEGEQATTEDRLVLLRVDACDLACSPGTGQTPACLA